MNQHVSVWDPLVRIFHWSLVTAFAVSWFTAEEWDQVHEYSGYVIAGLVGFRVVWGLVGSRHARFRAFVKGPRATLTYLNDIRRRQEKRYLGHNPAGGAMIVALLTMLSLTCLTGWLQTTDRFWGVEWMQETHELLANGLLLLVAFHLVGVGVASIRHRENLPKAMITGRKRVADEPPLSPAHYPSEHIQS